MYNDNIFPPTFLALSRWRESYFLLSRPFILVVQFRQRATGVRGGGRVQHWEPLGKTCLIGHYSFCMRGLSETESGYNLVKPSRIYAACLGCVRRQSTYSLCQQSKCFQISCTVLIQSVVHSTVMTIDNIHRKDFLLKYNI